ncbi:membrane protein [Candidatus Magnetoovum chiemensis]|nr:membrane protein [Candidatus Magnetoovum chiemensis]
MSSLIVLYLLCLLVIKLSLVVKNKYIVLMNLIELKLKNIIKNVVTGIKENGLSIKQIGIIIGSIITFIGLFLPIFSAPYEGAMLKPTYLNSIPHWFNPSISPNWMLILITAVILLDVFKKYKIIFIGGLCLGISLCFDLISFYMKIKGKPVLQIDFGLIVMLLGIVLIIASSSIKTDNSSFGFIPLKLLKLKNSTDITEKLKTLSELRKQCVITNEEFIAKKNELLKKM